MTNTEKTRSAASNHDSDAAAASMTQPTIQQQPAGSSKTKELRSHPGITIKWSLDPASRRRIGLPPAAAIGAVAPVAARFGGASC
ncbi:hypothetical protein [Kribbella antiqua]|uniref:hypothetical protein n=1 Tax=Kribbella antiqua TaxID=2512217 RepID=UPI001051252E|nr:hypothetical protein [Kribbella antiqua]